MMVNMIAFEWKHSLAKIPFSGLCLSYVSDVDNPSIGMFGFEYLNVM